MIYYRPTDGDPLTSSINYLPRTCFIMTSLGTNITPEIAEIRAKLKTSLRKHSINEIDANSKLTGRDFLLKIWGMVIAVPLGIAIIARRMSPRTLANIFYEIGLFQAYGKETLVIKTKDAKIPSDFVRTEYLEYNKNFNTKVDQFLKHFFTQPGHFEIMAKGLASDPLLAIDFYRRAYLITGDRGYRAKARVIFNKSAIKTRAPDSVEMLLMNF